MDLQLKRFLFLVYHNHYNEHTMTSMTSRPGWWANWRPRKQTWWKTWWKTRGKTWEQDTWWKKVLVIMSDVRKYTYIFTAQHVIEERTFTTPATSKCQKLTETWSRCCFSRSYSLNNYRKKILFTYCVCECYD